MGKLRVLLFVFCLSLLIFILLLHPVYSIEEPGIKQADEDTQPNNFFVPSQSVTKAPIAEQETTRAMQTGQPPQPSQVPPQPATDTTKVTLNFEDADIYSVIQTIFGDILKVNYVIDPRVKGRVNFRSVKPIDKEDVLPLMEVILRINGIGMVEEAGLYRIVPIGSLSREPTSVDMGRESERVQVSGKAVTQIIPVKYLESSEMVKILTPFLSENAVIMDIPKSNLIVIVDTDTNVKRLLKLVEIFDTEDVVEKKPRVFVYPVQNGKAKDIADILNQIFLQGGSSKQVTKRVPKAQTHKGKVTKEQRPLTTPRIIQSSAQGVSATVSDITKIFPDEVTNSIIILATPEDYQIIEDAIKKIDIVPRQVLIEVLVAEVTLSDSLQFGVEWFLKSHFSLNNTPLTGFTSAGSDRLSFDVENPLSSTGFTFAAVDSADVVRGLLQSLAAESKVKILASPHIMASDNREAKIQVGKQVPVQTSTSTTAGGETVTSIQYRDTGVVLSVKPRINEGGLVSLEVKQEVSSVDPEAGVAGNPIISNRMAETNLVVQDGQTIIIGGLMQESASTVREGVPLLKDIPILGLFFGYTSKSNEKTELLVSITPHVIRDQGEAAKVSSEFIERYKRDTGLQKEEDLSQSQKKGEDKDLSMEEDN